MPPIAVMFGYPLCQACVLYIQESVGNMADRVTYDKVKNYVEKQQKMRERLGLQ
jgi:hypothetical protein